MTIDETNLPDDAEALIREVARRIRRTTADLRGPRKFIELVEGRRVIARRLRALEWSFPRIGRELQKDHSTIINLLRPKARRAAPAPVPAPPAGAP